VKKALLVLLAAVAISIIAGCAGGSSQSSTQAPQVISTNPNDWSFQYSTGMPANPSPSTSGLWEIALPVPTNSLNYVTTPFGGVPAQSMSMTFEVVAPNGAVYGITDPNSQLPPTVHMYMQRCGDNLSGQGAYAAYRWWAKNGYAFGSNDNTTITLTAPLTVDNWTNVGTGDAPTAANFQAALNNLCDIGMTFGGSGEGWGHGMNATPPTGDPPVKFVLKSISLI